DDSPASGLLAFDAGAGVESLGVAAASLYQFSASRGLYGYLKYDRLVGDAAGSPITRSLGSRDQWSGGVALSYTFGHGVQ
ncbi:MAG: MipA/OmpV family protein, partial [Acidobacteriota bacterium]